MLLREVMGDAAAGLPEVEIEALAYDNRVVAPGTLFFCVRGFTRDGHDFAPDAVARGASALVVDHELGDQPVPQVVVEDVRAAMAPAAAALVGRGTPLSNLPLGTMNLLAKDLGLPFDLDGAIANLARCAAPDRRWRRARPDLRDQSGARHGRPGRPSPGGALRAGPCAPCCAGRSGCSAILVAIRGSR